MVTSTMKRKLQVLVLSTAIFLQACGGIIAGFKAGIAASKPFVQSLVDSHTITQAQADLATVDIEDSIDILSTAQTCLNKITSAGAAKRVDQAQCYFTSAQSLRAILARHHFGVSPRLNQIAAIAEGAILAFETFYNQATSPLAIPAGASTASREKALDAAYHQLEATMKVKEAEMKALMKQ